MNDLMKSVTSLHDYVAQVFRIYDEWGKLTSTTNPWFRGQADVRWKLKPRLYRDEDTTKREREMVRDFKLWASPFIEREPENDLELYFVMQHYGMPTRLLDWTENHLAALFFALTDDTMKCDGAVWILGPASLNQASSLGFGLRVPMSNAPKFKQYTFEVDATPIVRKVEASEPVAVRPVRSTPRIVAQRGMFTIHGSDKISLEDYARKPRESAVRLTHIRIDGTSMPRLKKELYLAGVSYASLFPDLDGLSREIQYRYSETYMSKDKLVTT